MIWSYITSFVVYQSLYLSICISGRYVFYIIMMLSHLCLISLGPGFPDFPVLGGVRKKGKDRGEQGVEKIQGVYLNLSGKLRVVFLGGMNLGEFWNFRGCLDF